MPLRPLAPCRCGHPGAGCSCYEERAAEAGWQRGPTSTGSILPGGCGTNPFQPIEELLVRRTLDLVAADVDRNTCRACGEMIRVMVFRGTGYCSGRCRG